MKLEPVVDEWFIIFAFAPKAFQKGFKSIAKDYTARRREDQANQIGKGNHEMRRAPGKGEELEHADELAQQRVA